MDTCPKCHRKLLVHSSKCCNWCGCVVEDAAYQDDAAKQRDTFFTRDRIRQAEEIASVEATGPTPEYYVDGAFLQKTVFAKHQSAPAGVADAPVVPGGDSIAEPAPSEKTIDPG